MKILPVILLTIFLFSCRDSNNTLKKFNGNSFIFPDKMLLVPEDTIIGMIVKKGNYKLIAYFDSLSCTPCLFSSSYQWAGLIDFTEYYSNRVSTYLIFTPRKSEWFYLKEFIVSENPFDYPVLLDNKGEIKKTNPWLPPGTFVCLTDSCNKVVLAGNPMIPKIWEEYKTIIKATKYE